MKFLVLNVDFDGSNIEPTCIIHAADGNEAERIYIEELKKRDTSDERIASCLDFVQFIPLGGIEEFGNKPQINRDDIKRMIKNEGLTIEKVIEAVIELNYYVGVGIISLGDTLKTITHSKCDNSWRGQK